MKELLFMWQDFRPDAKRFLLAMMLMPMAPLATLLQPYLLKRLIDGPFAQAEWGLVLHYGLGILTLVLVDFAARGVVLSVFQSVGQTSLARLRLRMFNHILLQGASYFDRTPLGVLLTRASSDIETVSDLFSTGVVSIVMDVMFMVGLVIFLFTIHVKLALLFLVIIPVCVLVLNFYRVRLKFWFNELRSSLARVNAFFEESLRGVEVIRGYMAHQEWSESFDKIHRRYRDATFKNNLYDSFLYATMEAILAFSIAWILWLGIDEHINTAGMGLSIGVLVAFIEYAQKLFIPIKEFSGKMAMMQRSVVSLSRIREILETHFEIKPGIHVLPGVSECVIQARDLEFRYSPHLPPALSNINFTWKTGQLIALVGETGAGKTTLTRLLTRTYEGYQGTFTWNGVEISHIRLDSLLENVAIIQQEAIVFSASVLENVRLFKTQVEESRVREALGRVHALEWVDALPQGLHTPIGPQGIALSAGQSQVIQLARLFLFPARLLVMDEATSQIDSESERLIQDALSEVFRHYTSVVVAHRLSTILRADQIIVFHQGRIVEMGRHFELMERRGSYFQLFAKQFESMALA